MKCLCPFSKFMLAIFYCMTFFLNKQINCSKRFQNFNVQSFSLILGIGIKARIPFYPSCPSARKNKKISSSCTAIKNRSTCKYFMNYYFCKNLLSSNLYIVSHSSIIDFEIICLKNWILHILLSMNTWFFSHQPFICT